MQFGKTVSLGKGSALSGNSEGGETFVFCAQNGLVTRWTIKEDGTLQNAKTVAFCDAYVPFSGGHAEKKNNGVLIVTDAE